MHRHHDGDSNAGTWDAVVPMLLICALTIAVIVVMLWVDATWSGPILVASLVVCLILMLLVGALAHRSTH